MTPRKPPSPDAITLAEAAELLGMPETTVTRFRREGLLKRLVGYPSYSRSDIQEFIDNPWLNGRQAAVILGVSHERVSQLANAERIPVHHSKSGPRVYRKQQIETIARGPRQVSPPPTEPISRDHP